MKRKCWIIVLAVSFILTSCGSGIPMQTNASQEDDQATEILTEPIISLDDSRETGNTEMTTTASGSIDMESILLEINGSEIPVIWEDNESVEALRDFCKAGSLTIEMSMYGGFEQVGPIGRDLPRDDEQITTESGDIVLYSGDQIVLFYGSNSWSYTRLGRMELSEEELTDLLGKEDVNITISVK